LDVCNFQDSSTDVIFMSEVLGTGFLSSEGGGRLLLTGCRASVRPNGAKLQLINRHSPGLNLQAQGKLKSKACFNCGWRVGSITALRFICYIFMLLIAIFGCGALLVFQSTGL